jgi:heme exporter protein D
MPILFLLLFVGFFVLLLIFIVVRVVFSILNPRNYFRSNKQKNQRESDYSSSRQQHTSKKIFEKSEGEYVDYEEVK